MTDTKSRLLDVGARLFAERGYDGVSVREICAEAETTSNMIHYYFDNKEGLYNAILETVSDNVFLTPLRVIEREPRTREEFVTRFELFVEESLEALIANKYPYTLMVRDQVLLEVFTEYIKRFTHFVDRARKKGFVRSQVQGEMITGLVLDRLGNQVIWSSWIRDATGYDIVEDERYRRQWLRANLDVILNGIVA